MSDAAIGGVVLWAVWYFVCFLIGVAICRWAFRINHIVDRLDQILRILAEAYPSKETPQKPPPEPENIKMTLGDPYMPSANRFPRQD